MRVRHCLAVAVATGVAFATASAQGNAWNPQEILKTEAYVKPPANIERMIMAPRVDISFTQPNSDRSWYVRAVGPTRGDIQAYGKTHTYLGGLAVDKIGRAHV